MNSTSSSHHADGSNTQSHSAGSLYPVAVYARQASPAALSWWVDLNGVHSGPYPSETLARLAAETRLVAGGKKPSLPESLNTRLEREDDEIEALKRKLKVMEGAVEVLHADLIKSRDQAQHDQEAVRLANQALTDAMLNKIHGGARNERSLLDRLGAKDAALTATIDELDNALAHNIKINGALRVAQAEAALHLRNCKNLAVSNKELRERIEALSAALNPAPSA